MQYIAGNVLPAGKTVSPELGRRGSVFVVKQSQDMVNKTFRFPQELLDQLEQVAREKNVSVNNLVKQCCEYALGDLPKDEK